MSINSSNTYFLITKNNMGIGALHKNALCYLAYGTALHSLNLRSKVSSDWIKKNSVKKVDLNIKNNKLEISLKIPIKISKNMSKIIENVQNDIIECFSKFLHIDLINVNVIIEDVYL